MTDIVERLRSGELCGEDRCRVMDEAGGCTCAIAADEITRLRAENERLSTKLSNTASARILQGKVIAELSAENERLREALTRIYAWYPKSATRPHETIHDIQEYARKARDGDT